MTAADTTDRINEVSYLRWRAQIPWTDSAIVAALHEIAAELREHQNEEPAAFWAAQATRFARTHRLSGFIVHAVVKRLITVCAHCDKTALYRVGVLGYCRTHKALAVARRLQFNAAHDHRKTERAEMYADRERNERQRDKLARLHKGSGPHLRLRSS